MDTSDDSSMSTIIFVVLQKQFSRCFVQSGLGVRINKEAFDGDQDVRDSVFLLPIFLQSVDTYFASFRHVWMEDFGCKPTCLRDWGYI
jgi:hypothetical protein